MPTDIDRNELVDAVREAIDADGAFDGLQVERFPDDPRVFVQKYLKSKRGAVLVSYAGTRKQGGEGSASRLARLDLVVIASGQAKALDYIGDLEALDGKRFFFSFGSGHVNLRTDQFIGETNRRYQYLVQCYITID